MVASSFSFGVQAAHPMTYNGKVRLKRSLKPKLENVNQQGISNLKLMFECVFGYLFQALGGLNTDHYTSVGFLNFIMR